MESRQRVFLLPGDIAFAREPTTISTLLGSCVAVCLYDEHNRWGGMNHFMLPSRAPQSRSMAAGKYGDYAIGRLIQLATRSGSRPGTLVASVYGGAHVAGHLGSSADLGLFDVGRRNGEIAFATLRERGIRVLRHDIGGNLGRKIHMDSDSNEIVVQTHGASAERQERARKLEEFRGRRVRILIIDDSRTVRHILRKGVELADDLEVVGEAADPYEAREKILELDPDVLCLDIIMPRMDGLTFLKRVMRYRPIPTVIVSTMAKRGTAMRDKARKAGAVAVIDKDELCIYQGTQNLERELVPKLRQAAATVLGKSC